MPLHPEDPCPVRRTSRGGDCGCPPMRSGGCPCTPEWSCSSPSGTSPFPPSNVGEKPTVILYTYINRHAGTPEKKRKEKKRKEKKRKEKKRKEKMLLLFFTFSVLVANPKKLLYTMSGYKMPRRMTSRRRRHVLKLE